MQGDPNRALGVVRRAAAAFHAGHMDEAGSFCRLALAANKKEFHALLESSKLAQARPKLGVLPADSFNCYHRY